MKKFNKTCLTILGLLTCFFTSQAYDFQKDGIYYNILSGNNYVEVVDNADFSEAYSGDVIIPVTVNYNGRDYTVFSIGEQAFAACYNLLSVKIEAPIQIIGEGAFANCLQLSEIELPEGLINIGLGAFQNCEKLTYIEFPNTLLIIGEAAFSNCIGLTEINIPDSVKVIESSAFYGCENLKEIYLGRYLTDCNMAFTGCPIENATLACEFVPTSLLINCTFLKNLYLNDTVTNISFSSFQGCSSLSTIRFSTNLAKIYDYAFEGCSSLSSLDLPTNLEYVGSYAFRNCTGLKTLNLAKVEDIDEGAFYGCIGLTELIIPDSVKAVRLMAFGECKSLKSVTIGTSLLPQYTNFLYDCPIEEVTFNSSTVPGNLFTSFSTLKSVILSNNVTAIEEEAFFGCINLKTLELSENLTYIGSTAFMDCQNLNSIEIPQGITEIRFDTFNNCIGLSSVSFSSALKKIGDRAFYNCYNLKNIDLPDGIEEIGFKAFAECNSLEQVIIPESVAELGRSAFQNCKNLREVSIGSVFESIGEDIYVSVDHSMVFEGSPIEIASINCEYVGRGLWRTPTLKTVIFGDKVERIGYSAFLECTALTDVILPDKLTQIGDNAFDSCTSLLSINIPDAVEKIGSYAFAASGLKEITVGKGLTQCGDLAFGKCPVETVTMNCVEIPNWILHNSTLNKLTLGESVERIGNYAFLETLNLKEVILPKSIRYIGYEAFYDGGLEKVLCYSTEIPELDSPCFKNMDNKEMVLYVPEVALDAYKDSEWSWPFSEILPIESAGITEIFGQDFSGVIKVYDFSGRLVMNTKDSEDLNNLKSGLYIINGQKVLIGK